MRRDFLTEISAKKFPTLSQNMSVLGIFVFAINNIPFLNFPCPITLVSWAKSLLLIIHS